MKYSGINKYEPYRNLKFIFRKSVIFLGIMGYKDFYNVFFYFIQNKDSRKRKTSVGIKENDLSPDRID